MKRIILIFLVLFNYNSFGQNTITLNLPYPCSYSVSQDIPLPQGWSMFSTYISPVLAGIDTILGEIDMGVVIVKSGEGEVYWPEYGVDQIGDVSIGEGFQIKMAVADTLIVTGTPLIPEETPITLPQGWSIFGYLRQSPAAIETMLSTISGIVILKNGAGQVYWPQYVLNQIGNMNPGEGYQVKMTVPQTLLYPANSLNLIKTYNTLPSPFYYTGITNTGANAALGIPVNAWDETPAMGDEIGIFDGQGALAGASVFTGGFTAITLWGDDQYSKPRDGMKQAEPFFIRLWKPGTRGGNRLNMSEGIEMIYVIDQFSCDLNGWQVENRNPEYHDNAIYIISSLRSKTTQIKEFSLQNVPNPFRGETEIQFYLPYSTTVAIDVFNIMGERLVTLVNQPFDPGRHTVVFDAGNYPAGNYFYRFITPEFIRTEVMSISK
jgi:hypothetical protein